MAPGILIITNFLLSFASIVDVIKTESSPTVGAAASSFATCSLWTLPFAQDLAFIASSLLEKSAMIVPSFCRHPTGHLRVSAQKLCIC
jgi:hypothetical protein